MQDIILYKDGEPCSHKGCLSNISHPCEGCGRTGGKGIVYKESMNEFIEYFKKQTGAQSVSIFNGLNKM